LTAQIEKHTPEHCSACSGTAISRANFQHNYWWSFLQAAGGEHKQKMEEKMKKNRMANKPCSEFARHQSNHNGSMNSSRSTILDQPRRQESGRKVCSPVEAWTFRP